MYSLTRRSQRPFLWASDIGLSKKCTLSANCDGTLWERCWWRLRWFVERGWTMKSKLSVALAAAGYVLAASPANAISFTIDPGITSSVPGAVLFDDFDSVQNTAIGTITGGILNMGSAACVCASGGNFIGTGGGQDAITVMFTNPVSYAGFTWGTPDRANT